MLRDMMGKGFLILKCQSLALGVKWTGRNQASSVALAFVVVSFHPCNVRTVYIPTQQFVPSTLALDLAFSI